jgi:hypothetical protein
MVDFSKGDVNVRLGKASAMPRGEALFTGSPGEVNNLRLTPPRDLPTWRFLIFAIRSHREKALLTQVLETEMSAKRETFYVVKTDSGWVVRTDASQDRLGPYSDRERAMTAALIFARDNRPSQVKVRTAAEHWRVECIFDERGRPST